jgi:hypothetical protein
MSLLLLMSYLIYETAGVGKTIMMWVIYWREPADLDEFM